MQSRQRVLTALNHQEPDRVPFDLGGTIVTGIQAKAYHRLLNYLGLPGREVIISDIRQQLAQVDDDVLDILGGDVRNVSPESASDYQRVIQRTEDGRYDYFFDEFGIGWRMPVVGGITMTCLTILWAGISAKLNWSNTSFPTYLIWRDSTIYAKQP